MMFSPEQVNLMLRLVDAEIEAEITRICTPVAPKMYEDLITVADMEFGQQIGITLSI